MIKEILKKRVISEEDFEYLLSESASVYLEDMAVRVNKEHLNHFGKSIVLYTPLYISNYCVNQCQYCSYNACNDIKRSKLTLEEIEHEAINIASTGLKHILLLTGESEKDTPLSYILQAVEILKKYFSSVTIEIYPLTEEQYRVLVNAGVDGLTIYQETYDKTTYKTVHPYGPKSDYDFRYHAPERGAKAGMYTVNIGALLGLHDWKNDVLSLGRHLKYLEESYPQTAFHVSIPRIKPFKGQPFESQEISDKTLVQIILALKLYSPYMGINVSTRENEMLREQLLPLGVAKMSAGVSTNVGGHVEDKGDAQFEISDKRSVKEIQNMLNEKGYQPVLVDWIM